MVWLTHLILLSVLNLFKCDCVLNHQPLEEAWDKKLHDDLKAGHRWHEDPNNCNITKVRVNFLMNSFSLDETDYFTMHSTMSLFWRDKKLKWNPSEYGGVKKTYFRISMFWIPFVELKNGEDDGYILYHEQCSLDNTGLVNCRLRTEYYVQCATKMGNWPYDSQKCTLEFRMSKYQKNVHLLPLGKRAVIKRAEVDQGSEFTVAGYHQESNTSDEVQLRITFILNRNGESIAAIMIFPAILLSILTVCSIILDVNDINRSLMILFSMFCHCFYLPEIGWEVPKQSEEPPTIVLFYRSSLIVTLFLIVATVILGKLRNKESAPSPWVSSVYSFVLNSHGKYFIWPRWETNIDLLTSEDVDVKFVNVWNGFANILNSACFFVTLLVYSIMIPVCVPKRHPYTYVPNNNSLFFSENDF